ncbi:hypothetical protein C8R43DRAFT_1141834 [Mycena crocata]|nr:hypothetical protein C8R43DRAFT_1141834 [Mycena crocata]
MAHAEIVSAGDNFDDDIPELMPVEDEDESDNVDKQVVFEGRRTKGTGPERQYGLTDAAYRQYLAMNTPPAIVSGYRYAVILRHRGDLEKGESFDRSLTTQGIMGTAALSAPVISYDTTCRFSYNLAILDDDAPSPAINPKETESLQIRAKL